jgi:Alanine-zipper, major outer membrane lipoprotein
MSAKSTSGVGLGLAGVLLMLGACQSVTPDEMRTLESRVATLESRASAAESRASQLEAAANQCTTTCQDAEATAERIYQQSLRK